MPTNQYRWLLALAGGVYFAWWFLVEALLPGAFNPFGSRAAVVSVFGAAISLSFVSRFARQHLRLALVGCLWLLTAHYFYLYARNGADFNWVTGAYITVLAVGAIFDTPRSLWLYSAFVLLAMTISSQGHEHGRVALPGMVTVLILLNVVLILRRKAEGEKEQRRRLEAEMKAAETVGRAKTAFVANISHELRTPLASIIGYSELLADSKSLSAEQVDHLTRVRRNAQSLLGIVDQILALTDDSDESLRLRLEPIAIKDMIREVVDGLRPVMKENGLDATVEFAPGTPDTISFDPVHLRRILGNVVANAVKFSLKGQITVRASLLPSGALEVLVSDQGIGIEAADWERIFESFTQVQGDLDRPFGGSGIGLTVARRLARAFGGDVTLVDSRPGIGSTFRILLMTG